MAVTYGFYNSSNGDRKYNAEQFGSIFDGIILDGIFELIGDHFAVTPVGGSLAVYVGTGRAWFNHTWTLNDSNFQVTLEASNLVLPRIDAIVLEVNESTRTNSFKVVTGTAASSPQKPTLTNTQTVHQYALAYITVPYGATTISQANIENHIGTDDCPFVTGPLQVLQTNEMVAQWQAIFEEWFDSVKGQLSTDPAGNLQNQIDAIDSEVGYRYKASFSQGEWRNLGSYYTQTASLVKMDTNAPSVTSSGRFVSGPMCEKTTNESTNDTLQDNLTIFNMGYATLGSNQVTARVFEEPTSDMEIIWLIKGAE